MKQPDWEAQVLAKTNVEKIFLTNDFDDPLDDFDAQPLRPLACGPTIWCSASTNRQFANG